MVVETIQANIFPIVLCYLNGMLLFARLIMEGSLTEVTSTSVDNETISVARAHMLLSARVVLISIFAQ